jgi:ATP-dependent Lon protease
MFDDGKTPRRHNMKKEPEIVKTFVKLLTSPMEDTNIDTQIDQFKSLSEEKQQQIIKTLQARPPANDVNSSLMFKILDMKLPPDIQSYVLSKYQTLDGMDPNAGEYFKIRNWLDKVSAVPFGQYKEMPVKLIDGPPKCEEFMKYAKSALDGAVFGQAEAKLQILQFIAAKISNPTADGTCLLLVGPAGIGKTSLIKNGISKALAWPFQFISLGGETDASTYTGHQMVYEGSHAGKIVNSLIAAKSMSMVMMFDEIDKISATAKGEEIQHMLVHLTDPVQNMCFEDKYLANIPIDLSKIMFVFSANDISKIDRILLDRMRVVHLKGYDMAEKINIAQNFLVPEALAQVNLVEKVSLSKEIIQYIVENHAKEEAGVREMRRCIEQIAQKVNMLRMYNSKDLTFHIPGFQLPFIVKKEHVDMFIKKRPDEDQSFRAMYI